MILPKPFLGRALIEAIEINSKEFLQDKLKQKVGKELYESAEKAGIILDDPDIFRETERSVTGKYEQDHRTGEVHQITENRLGKSRLDAKVPLTKGKIIEAAPDFGGEKFLNNNGGDVGYVPTIGDIVWFVPNDTFAIDANRKYHLINDCDIVAYEKGETC